MSERVKRQRPIPIAWATCRHCGERYDEGNAAAHFSHAVGDCPRPAVARQPVPEAKVLPFRRTVQP